MIEENRKEKLIGETYNLIFNEKEVVESSLEEKSQFQEFKELVTELWAHANEYNVINSKFFGRDSLMVKVILHRANIFENLYFNWKIQKIKEYILNDSRNPFIITGESGKIKIYKRFFK